MSIMLRWLVPFFIVIREVKEDKMDTSDIHSSGVLNKGEEIIDCIKGRYYKNKKKKKGLITFTNKRFLCYRTGHGAGEGRGLPIFYP